MFITFPKNKRHFEADSNWLIGDYQIPYLMTVCLVYTHCDKVPVPG